MSAIHVGTGYLGVFLPDLLSFFVSPTHQNRNAYEEEPCRRQGRKVAFVRLPERGLQQPGNASFHPA